MWETVDKLRPTAISASSHCSMLLLIAVRYHVTANIIVARTPTNQQQSVRLVSSGVGEMPSTLRESAIYRKQSLPESMHKNRSRNEINQQHSARNQRRET